MFEVADDVWQLPLVPRDGINAYLVGDVLVDTGIKQ
jgi:hydroxyacylglutathione hydrolase